MASKLMILLVATNALNLLVSIGAHGTEHGDRPKGKPLVNKGNNPTEPLDRCEGDCDRNDDCKGNLRCRQRDAGDPIPPGCSGKAHSPTHDYCWDPKSTKKMVDTESTVRAQGLCIDNADPKLLLVRHFDVSDVLILAKGLAPSAATNVLTSIGGHGIRTKIEEKVDRTITTVYVPFEGTNWKVGTTLDDHFVSGLPSPFTDDSVAAFREAWDTKRKGAPDSPGHFDYGAKVLKSNKDKRDFLDISANIEGNYFAFSADAHMKYMSENVASETEVSVMLKANSGGQKYQLSQRATNLLKLKDNSPATLSQFNEAYGDYLIVGWIYGGAILYESKYSAQSSSDKMEVEAGLCASYGGAGFGVSGCANVGNTKDILGKSVNHQVTHHIQPNVQSVDVDNLIDALNRLSGGDGEATDTYSDIEKSAQKILSGDDLNPIQAVIIPLSSVSAVADKYKMDPDQQSVSVFMEFLNKMYLKVKSLSKQLDLVYEQWQKYGPEQKIPVPMDTIEEWKQCLNYDILGEMLNLTTTKRIVKHAKKWHALNHAGHSWNTDVLTAETFVQLNVDGMQIQFDSAIQLPFEKMLKGEFHCDSHDDCPTDLPLCYATTGSCKPCSECHYCRDGIDGTCGSCGDGYPTQENDDCTNNPEPVSGCLPLSNVDGRCGPLFGGGRCNLKCTDGRICPYCDSANGWCGPGLDWKNVQPNEDKYDYYATACEKSDCDCTFTGYADGYFRGNQWTTSTVGSWVNVGGDVGGNVISALRVDGSCTVTVADGLDGDTPMSPVYESGSHDYLLPTGNDNIESVLLQCGTSNAVSAQSPGMMIEDPFDADDYYDPIFEDPANESWSHWHLIHYYDLITVLMAALVVLCAVNLCVTVRQRQQAPYVVVKHFDTESERDVEAMPMIQ